MTRRVGTHEPDVGHVPERGDDGEPGPCRKGRGLRRRFKTALFLERDGNESVDVRRLVVSRDEDVIAEQHLLLPPEEVHLQPLGRARVQVHLNRLPKRLAVARGTHAFVSAFRAPARSRARSAP